MGLLITLTFTWQWLYFETKFWKEEGWVLLDANLENGRDSLVNKEALDKRFSWHIIHCINSHHRCPFVHVHMKYINSECHLYQLSGLSEVEAHYKSIPQKTVSWCFWKELFHRSEVGFGGLVHCVEGLFDSTGEYFGFSVLHSKNLLCANSIWEEEEGFCYLALDGNSSSI